MGIFGVLSDMAALLRGAVDHKIPPPSIIPPFVMDTVNRMKAENDEFIIEQWNKELQKEVLNGRKNLIEFLNRNNGINKEYNLGFDLIDLSEKLLNSILQNEVIEYDKSSVNFKVYLINKSQGAKEASILVQSIEDSDKYNRLTIKHYIHALYIKDLKI
ncbi:hypothetical protein ACP3T3_05790 [Chryseobacterium sp. CBSDS_008]|uniref:hypothetical protein n=1 Tax=Chryseobacterium sp. CBSDS_008 TaxID=3415265 RepID=UPI003CF1B1D9